MERMSAVTHPCGICGKRDRSEAMVYSRFTGSRYCADKAACDRRAKRNKKAKATA